jgi:hypothetical protein
MCKQKRLGKLEGNIGVAHSLDSLFQITPMNGFLSPDEKLIQVDAISIFLCQHEPSTLLEIYLWVETAPLRGDNGNRLSAYL